MDKARRDALKLMLVDIMARQNKGQAALKHLKHICHR